MTGRRGVIATCAGNLVLLPAAGNWRTDADDWLSLRSDAEADRLAVRREEEEYSAHASVRAWEEPGTYCDHCGESGAHRAGAEVYLCAICELEQAECRREPDVGGAES